jgi:hypothetical protein
MVIMEAVKTSETSVNSHETVRCKIPEKSSSKEELIMELHLSLSCYASK